MPALLYAPVVGRYPTTPCHLRRSEGGSDRQREKDTRAHSLRFGKLFFAGLRDSEGSISEGAHLSAGCRGESDNEVVKRGQSQRQTASCGRPSVFVTVRLMFKRSGQVE